MIARFKVVADLVKGHEALILWIGGLSVLMLVAVVILIPVVVVRLPCDYFAGSKRTPAAWSGRHPVMRLALLAGKTAAGVVFVLAGTAMLFLPGQGVLTILIGLTLLNFPGKFRLERRIVRVPPVIRSINWMRRRTGRVPLQVD